MSIPKDAIVLPPGRSADAGKCGSCYFFARDGDVGSGPMHEWYGIGGVCRFTFPPHVSMDTPQARQNAVDYVRPNAYVEDVDSCDLHRPDGKTYVVQILVMPVKK